MVWTLIRRLFFTAIFVSGASALIYQLIWVRLLGLVFGVSSFAVATVVAVFMLGLGLGSYFFGRWSERTRDPLRVYLYVELGIAATSLLAYLVIEALPVYRHLYEYAYNNLGFYGLSVARLLLSTLVLLPPVFLIGGTMPLLAKYFLRNPDSLGSSFSKLYYLNTLGATAGVLLTGFVFVRFFGVIGTLMIAVGGNLLVALILVNLSLLIAVAFLLRSRRPATAQGVAVVIVAAVANMLAFTDSKTFHAELKGRDLRAAAEGFDVIYYAEGLSGTDIVYESYADPDLEIVLDDARNYIATTEEEFSVIVTDVTNLKYKRNPYLYTREYFEIMRDALSTEGVAAAWLPIGGLSFNDLRTLIATVDNVYELASMLLLGESESMHWSMARRSTPTTAEFSSTRTWTCTT